MPKTWRKPLEDEAPATGRKIVIIRDRCKGCGFCVEFCPRDVLKMSDEFNAKGYHPPVVVDIDRCVECNLCEIICPEFAIFTDFKPLGKPQRKKNKKEPKDS